MKDQRWANRPDAVAKRPDKRRRIAFVLIAFVLIAGALIAFEALGGAAIDESLNPAPVSPEAGEAVGDAAG